MIFSCCCIVFNAKNISFLSWWKYQKSRNWSEKRVLGFESWSVLERRPMQRDGVQMQSVCWWNSRKWTKEGKIYLCKYTSPRWIRRYIWGENTYRMMIEDSTCWAFYGSHLVEQRWKICAGSEICSGHVANVFGHFICKSAHLTPRDGLIRCVISL